MTRVNGKSLARIISLVNRAAQSAESNSIARSAADTARTLAGQGMPEAADALLDAGYAALAASTTLLESAKAALKAINAEEILRKEEELSDQEGELLEAYVNLERESWMLWGAIRQLDCAVAYCREKGGAAKAPSVQAAAAGVYRAALERIEADRRQFEAAKAEDDDSIPEG